MKQKISYIPKSVRTKIYKTGQTRGADDDVIFQNRVGRNSTVLIPFEDYSICVNNEHRIFENGFIVLIKPEIFFDLPVLPNGLVIGENLLVFYETRDEWVRYPPLEGWKPALSRKAPLLGEYVARVPATTSAGQDKIMAGFNTSKMKGAGIRVYEYADSHTISDCRLQLELLFWNCKDIDDVISAFDNPQEVREYVFALRRKAKEAGLYDELRLKKARIIDGDGYTICPLCLERISARGFCDKITQAEGRNVPDLTVTEVSLFHIRELRTGEYNHKPYNLGWGHHHCNVVVKDSGIEKTLEWMKMVLLRNGMLIK